MQLTSGEDSLGDGPGLVMGFSGIPIPDERYLDNAEDLFLGPHGFTGDAETLDLPNGLYPVTGTKSLPYDTSLDQDQQILDSAVHDQLDAGDVDADNPLTLFGWSQSSQSASVTMPQLADENVPSDDLHFVLLGDPINPNGGLLERFDAPGSDLHPPSLGVPFDAVGTLTNIADFFS